MNRLVTDIYRHIQTGFSFNKRWEPSPVWHFHLFLRSLKEKFACISVQVHVPHSCILLWNTSWGNGSEFTFHMCSWDVAVLLLNGNDASFYCVCTNTSVSAALMLCTGLQLKLLSLCVCVFVCVCVSAGIISFRPIRADCFIVLLRPFFTRILDF